MLPSVPKALKMWYEEFILPILTNFQAGTKTQDIITTDAVMVLLHDNLLQLGKVFKEYCANDFEERKASVDGAGDRVTAEEMSLKGFTFFANNAGFIDVEVVVHKSQEHRFSITGDRSSIGLGVRYVHQIFAASQHDDMDIADKKVDDVDHQQRMNIAELLEGVVRLGLLKYQNGTLADYDCIRKVSYVALIR